MEVLDDCLHDLRWVIQIVGQSFRNNTTLDHELVAVVGVYSDEVVCRNYACHFLNDFVILLYSLFKVKI